MFGHAYGWRGPGLGPLGWVPAPVLAVIVLWSVFWKGLALWHSARRGQNWWFVFLVIINSVGILDILYLLAVAKLKASELFSKK